MGTHASIKPIAAASLAGSIWPVNTSQRANPRPTRRVVRCVPPSPG